jgi:riboflavin synthase
MFTGIVQTKCTINRIESKPGLVTIGITLPVQLREDVNLGASIAIDGVCLTVTAFDEQSGLVIFDIMQETLNLTSLSHLQAGKWVNVERSAKANAEIGGHCVSGHVDGTAKVCTITKTENNLRISYAYPSGLNKYLFKKGFVSLNGCSLTIADIDYDKSELTVSYIPETLKISTHGEKVLGDEINIEVDRQTQAIVDTVERVLAQRALIDQQ